MSFAATQKLAINMVWLADLFFDKNQLTKRDEISQEVQRVNIPVHATRHTVRLSVRHMSTYIKTGNTRLSTWTVRASTRDTMHTGR